MNAARQSIRPDMEREADTSAREVYEKRYDSGLMEQSRKDVAAMLGEEERQASVREQLQQSRQKLETRAHHMEQSQNR